MAKGAQRGDGCTIPGRCVGWDSEQASPAEHIPAPCSGAGLHDISRALPTQTILGFCNKQALYWCYLGSLGKMKAKNHWF